MVYKSVCFGHCITRVAARCTGRPAGPWRPPRRGRGRRRGSAARLAARVAPAGHPVTHLVSFPSISGFSMSYRDVTIAFWDISAGARLPPRGRGVEWGVGRPQCQAGRGWRGAPRCRAVLHTMNGRADRAGGAAARPRAAPRGACFLCRAGRGRGVRSILGRRRPATTPPRPAAATCDTAHVASALTL